MLVKQEFKVDLIDLKNAAFPNAVLDTIKEKHAETFGYELCLRTFPYKKNEELSFKGSLPDMVFNREHQYVDTYEQRLIVLTEEDAHQLRMHIRRSNICHNKIIELENLLT